MPATIVSLAPYPINEQVPSVIPVSYVLKSSDGKVPQLLHLDHGKTALYLVGRVETLPVPVPAEQLADSIVRAHLTAQPEFSEDAHPALFWLSYKANTLQVLKDHDVEVKSSLVRQNRWFTKLVKAADDIWSKSKQRRFISDKYVIASQRLGLKREWAELFYADDQPPISLMNCPFCTYQILPQSVVCMNCKQVVNQEEYKKLPS